MAPGSIEEILRIEGGRVLASLVRMTGDWPLAEDAVSEATLEALRRWPESGIPERPGAWLTTVARRKALDVIRRESDRERREAAATALLEDDDPLPYNTVRDDQLRLLFTCCHPALAPEARVALSLRVVCGLRTDEIARAFLVPDATMGQRISRAKAKIAAGRIPYRIPPDHELPERLGAVLAVIRVVFTTGHHAPAGTDLERIELADEAARLARLVADLMPDSAEAVGLLALLESTQARACTRVGADGLPVLLADADRSQWDHAAIGAASEMLQGAMRLGRPGPYQVQAAISCLHGLAPDAESTDWAQIAELYAVLERMDPGPVVAVNRAVAVAEYDGPEAGLALLDAVEGAGRWPLWHSTRGEMLRRLDRLQEARDAFQAALDCGPNDVDAAFLRRRISALRDGPGP